MVQAYEGRAVLWTNWQPRIIGPSDPPGTAVAVNRRGEVVVRVVGKWPSGWYAHIWHEGKTRTLVAPKGSSATPEDINDSGRVVGACMFWPTARDHSRTRVPIVWASGNPKSLPVFPGGGGEAHAINNRGQVVGSVTSGEPDRRKRHMTAALWDASGRLWDLGRLVHIEGYQLQGAVDINNQGQILCVGAPAVQNRAAPEAYRPFLLTPRR